MPPKQPRKSSPAAHAYSPGEATRFVTRWKQGDQIDEQPTPPFLDMMVSAIRGDNMVSLLDLTLEKAGRSEQVVPFSARKRHLLALEAFRESVQHAIDAPAGLAELIAEDLRQAQQSLSEITGEFHSEDLLDAIFRTFCLGK